MSILEVLTKRRSTREQTALERYRNFIGRLAADEALQEPELGEFEDLAITLGYTIEGIAADTEAVKNFRAAVPVATGGEKLHAANKDANRAIAEHDGKWKAIVETHNAERLRLEGILKDCHKKSKDASAAEKVISDLKIQKPHLFA